MSSRKSRKCCHNSRLDVIGPSTPSDSIKDKGTRDWDIEMGDDLDSFLGSETSHQRGDVMQLNAAVASHLHSVS
jgi:hypothetical protein